MGRINTRSWKRRDGSAIQLVTTGHEARFREQCARLERVDIRTVRLDGKGHRNLTHRTRLDDSPGWSPDGQQIVFVSALDHSLDIYVMSASGRDKVNLTSTPRGTRNESPAWRPGS